MLSFIWWLIIGLIAGALARLIMPGRDSMSWLMTMLLGIVGSIVGGLVSWAIWGAETAGTRLSSRRPVAFDPRRNPRALDLAHDRTPQHGVAIR